MGEPRKASEVLLDLESKIDLILGIIRAQDSIIKTMSNKINNLIQNHNSAVPKIIVEAVNTSPISQLQRTPILDPEKQIIISAENKLPLENSPQGFRRTSRPETFINDPQAGVKAPPGREAEVIVPIEAMSKAVVVVPSPTQKSNTNRNVIQNAIPVQQRIVDRNGKSVFLADVEITDTNNGAPIFKTRTNGTGKWMASLGMGTYRVVVRKRESLSKEKIEVIQDIQVDGATSPLELKTMIIK